MRSTKCRSAWIAIAFALTITSGCEDESSGSPAGMGGASGTSSGAGGAGGTSGTSGGTGGAGGAGGVGTSGGGTSGGGTSGGDAPEAPAGCEAAVDGAPGELHAAAAAVLAMNRKCSLEGTCHSEATQSAGLIMLAAMDLNALLVDMPSCVAPDLSLVKSGGGDEALQASWLWIKLVAPADASGTLEDNSAWGAPAGSCGQSTDQPRGMRMPWGSSELAGEERLAPIRNWICAGAPGPE